MRYCQSCGVESAHDALFCPKCGARLAAPQSVKQSVRSASSIGTSAAPDDSGRLDALINSYQPVPMANADAAISTNSTMGRLTPGKVIFCLIVVFLVCAFFIGNTPSPEASKSSSPSPSHHSVGDTTTVVTGDVDNYPCGSTTAALDEMIKWATLKDSQEIARTIIKTDSTVLPSGTRVKVLDYEGFSKLKIRILGGTATGVECWVSTDWIN